MARESFHWVYHTYARLKLFDYLKVRIIFVASLPFAKNPLDDDKFDKAISKTKLFYF